MSTGTPAEHQSSFTFAVLADTHVTPDDITSDAARSPNGLANARMRHVVERLNRHHPDFVVHLGDLVHPVPSLPTYPDAAERFWALAAELEAPLHLVPGNHDVGDKPLVWSPAPTVTDASLDLYRRHFGADHYSFDHGDCHFVVVNTAILNSGLRDEVGQREWLERDLAEHAHRRAFVFTHYPPYIAAPDEHEHYDNVAEPARMWLLGLLDRYGVEALFAGHVHNFFYNRHAATDCYVLPSTAFVRQDYSELFRIGPSPDYGRGDPAKLGFMIVDVRVDGHVAHVVRSHGRTDSLGDGPTVAADVDTSRKRAASVGIDMPHPWAEIVELPYNDSVDRFARRIVRNDYPLLALWEMGAATIRVPIHDLRSETTARRMRDLGAVGYSFQVFTLDVPTDRDRQALLDNASVVTRLEVIVPPHVVSQRLEALARLRAATGLAVHLSRPFASDETTYDASRRIGHGFDARDEATLPLVANAPIDGLVFRVPSSRPVLAEIRRVQRLVESLSIEATVHVSLADRDASFDHSDDRAIANRVAETILAAWCANRTHVFLDTFADVDRGYVPRHGLTDRRYNPRLAGAVYRHLHAALDRVLGTEAAARDAGRSGETMEQAGEIIDQPGARVYAVAGGASPVLLVLPDGTLPQTDLREVIGTGTADIVDLSTGALLADADVSTTPTHAPLLVRPVRARSFAG